MHFSVRASKRLRADKATIRPLHPNAISYPDESGSRDEPDSLHFFRIVKEQPNQTEDFEKSKSRLRISALHRFRQSRDWWSQRDRTDDLLLAKQALSQLSYGPAIGDCQKLVVGLGGFEPPTPRLSSVCSNQLSYRPVPWSANRLHAVSELTQPISVGARTDRLFSRKEVIQPHLPIRLPCYDFTPVMNLTVVGALLAVRQPASGETHSHGVTGGVYKARERIHRDMLIRDY